ncbi:MAG: hypothetical protein PHP86_17095, partial [Nevskiales bacterium]|nr:hypothetical protein [Nevskiales bacterium]
MQRGKWFITFLTIAVIAGAAGLGWRQLNPPTTSGGSIVDAEPEVPCPPLANAEWRAAQTIDGVEIEADPSCEPDNPAVVAAVVKGTNRAVKALMDTRLARDTVIKRRDLDGDGDPDEIEIKLEVTELNG